MVLHNICNHGYSLGRIYHGIGHDVTIGFLIHKRIPHTEMVQFYNASDVVIDQFGGVGAFGNVTLEALACGKIVITEYDGSDYPEKPLIVAISVDNLAQTLLNYKE